MALNRLPQAAKWQKALEKLRHPEAFSIFDFLDCLKQFYPIKHLPTQREASMILLAYCGVVVIKIKVDRAGRQFRLYQWNHQVIACREHDVLEEE